MSELDKMRAFCKAFSEHDYKEVEWLWDRVGELISLPPSKRLEGENGLVRLKGIDFPIINAGFIFGEITAK